MPLGVCINRAQMHAKQVIAMRGHTNACTRNPRSINDGCGHVITRGLILYQHRTRLYECLMSLYVRYRFPDNRLSCFFLKIHIFEPKARFFINALSNTNEETW
jgi:hypothetical protein